MIAKKIHSPFPTYNYILTKTNFGRSGSVGCRLRHQSKTLDIKFGVKCKPQSFQRESLTVKDDKIATQNWRTFDNDLQQVLADLRLTKKPFTLLQIKYYVLGLDSFARSIPNIKESFDIFQARSQKEYEIGEISEGNLDKQGTWNRHIVEFFTLRYGNDAPLTAIVPADAKALDLWLKDTKKLSNNYVQYIMQHNKRVLNFCVESEFIGRNPLMNFRRKFDHKKGEYLTLEELKAVEETPLYSTSLERVKDSFILMCYTGLSFKDMEQLRKEHIIKTIEGDFYIQKPRQKTGVGATIYLTQKALSILAKYNDDEICNKKGLLVPILTNQKINNYLKQVAGICNISKNISCHTARRTFATILYNLGLEEKDIAQAMGHTNYAMSLKHYIHVTPEPTVKAQKLKLG